MELNTIIKKVLDALVFIAFLAFIIQFVNAMIEQRSASKIEAALKMNHKK